MLLHGPGFHYAYASDEGRERAADIYGRIEGGWDSEDGYSAASEARLVVAPMSHFLAFAGDALANGRWKISDAYLVFGPDFARHFDSVLWLARSPLSTLRGAESGVPVWIDQVPEFNMFDQQDCITLLALAMRMEQCRRADTYAHLHLEFAKFLRVPQTQAEVVRVVRRLRSVRRKRVPYVATPFFWQLFWIARPTVAQLTSHGEELTLSTSRAAHIRRRPFETSRRKLKRLHKTATLF